MAGMNAARALALAALAAGAACAEPLPISVGGRDDLPPEVEAACALVGLECAADPGGTWGTWALDLVEVAPSSGPVVHGVTRRRRACEPITWVAPEPDLIAHELGHALGLEHSSDEHGLMFPIDPGLELSADELRAIERGGDRLVACRP